MMPKRTSNIFLVGGGGGGGGNKTCDIVSGTIKFCAYRSHDKKVIRRSIESYQNLGARTICNHE